MASLSRGVTLALLGILLLGAARLPRGVGECGAEGAEGRDRPPAGAWWRGARVAEGAGGGGAVRGVPGTARRRRRVGAVAVPSGFRATSPRTQALLGTRGAPRSGARFGRREGRREGRAEAGPGDLAEAARRALGRSTWIVGGAGRAVRRETSLSGAPSHLSARPETGARKPWFSVTTASLSPHLSPVRPLFSRCPEVREHEFHRESAPAPRRQGRPGPSHLRAVDPDGGRGSAGGRVRSCAGIRGSGGGGAGARGAPRSRLPAGRCLRALEVLKARITWSPHVRT